MRRCAHSTSPHIDIPIGNLESYTVRCDSERVSEREAEHESRTTACKASGKIVHRVCVSCVCQKRLHPYNHVEMYSRVCSLTAKKVGIKRCVARPGPWCVDGRDSGGWSAARSLSLSRPLPLRAHQSAPEPLVECMRRQWACPLTKCPVPLRARSRVPGLPPQRTRIPTALGALAGGVGV